MADIVGLDGKATKALTDESLADRARDMLETAIRDGMVGIIMVIESQEGWEHHSIPESSFFLLGGIQLAHRSMDLLLKNIQDQH